MKDAQQKVETVALHINEVKRRVEQMSKLFEIQNRITGDFDTLIEPHRKLIREGSLTAITSSGLFGSLKPRKRLFFLFSDLLLWVSEENKYKGRLGLVGASLKMEGKGGNSRIEITTSKQNLILQGKDEVEIQSWYEKMVDLCALLQEERQKVRNRRVEKARNRGTNHAAKDGLHNLITAGLQDIHTGASSRRAEEEEDEDDHLEEYSGNHQNEGERDDKGENNVTTTPHHRLTLSGANEKLAQLALGGQSSSTSPSGSPGSASPASAASPAAGHGTTATLMGRNGTINLEMRGKFVPKQVMRRGRQSEAVGGEGGGEGQK